MCQHLGLPQYGNLTLTFRPRYRRDTGFCKARCVIPMEVELEADIRPGLLKLEPTIVGLSKFNESVQKLRNGEVAGCVASSFASTILTYL